MLALAAAVAMGTPLLADDKAEDKPKAKRTNILAELGLDKEKVNVNGGAIALGHPLGCTGAKLSVQLFDEMRKRNLQGKYGMVTMCVGTGQGAAGIYEIL